MDGLKPFERKIEQTTEPMPLAPAYESCYTTASLRVTQRSSWVKEQGSDPSVITALWIFRQVFSTFEMYLGWKCLSLLHVSRWNMKNEPLCVSFSLFRVIRVSSITEPLFSPLIHTRTHAWTMSRTYNQSDRSSDDKVWSRGLRHD